MRCSALAEAVIGAMVLLGLGLPGHATPVSVSQESAPGAGDFDANSLGTIESFNTTGTLAAFYAYASQQFTNTGSVTLTADQSHLFLVDASDGLGLFVVHDDGITRGGNAETQVDLLGGDTATFLVQDDPGEASYTDSGTVFTANQSWTQRFTDGYVIGSLDGVWTADIQFTDVPVAGPIITGLDTWAALSSDGMGGQTEIALSLVEDRRVRLVLIHGADNLLASRCRRGRTPWIGPTPKGASTQTAMTPEPLLRVARLSDTRTTSPDIEPKPSLKPLSPCQILTR